MSKISIISTLQRGSNGVGAFPVAIEDDLATSYVTVPTVSDRNALPEWKRKSNMVCHVIGDNKDYQLGADVTIPGQVWTEKTYNVPADVVTESELFDSNGFIKPQYIQNIFLNTNFVVSSEPAMLALTTFTGNFVIRTDTGDVWIKLNNTNPSSISDFALATPSASVVSVNGQTGVVNITIANLLSDPTNLSNFNTAVSNNSTVLGHSSSIASLTSSLATTNSNLTTLSAYVDNHLGGQPLDGSIIYPSPTQDGYVVKWNQSLGQYVLGVVTGGGGGGTSLNFRDLLDVPPSYTGQGLKLVRVKATEDGLEYTTPTGTISALSDVSLSGLADADLFMYKTSDSKWHNIAMSGDATISNTGVSTVNWVNGYTTYDTRYLKLSGGTMTGLLTLSGDPVSSLQAATKNYVDNLVTGLTWKSAAQVTTTINITLSGLQTIDGYTTIAGDRVLVKNQSTQTQNGLYTAAIGSWTRTNDADTGPELLGSTVYIENGTLYGGTQWSNNNPSITLGSTNITFVQIAGAGVYTSGTGLALTGNVFSVTTNGITNGLIRQSVGLSVIGNATNSTTNVADITGTSNQVLRVDGAGTTLGFGSLDLSQSATVGSSVLGIANGGTGATTFPGWLLASGGTLTGANNITGSTSNTLSLTFNSLAATQTDGAGVWLQNNTPATSSVQQYSPSIVLEGQGWSTGSSASFPSKFKIKNSVSSGASSSGTLQISYNGGSVFNSGADMLFMTVDTGGNFKVGNGSLNNTTSLYYTAGSGIQINGQGLSFDNGTQAANLIRGLSKILVQSSTFPFIIQSQGTTSNSNISFHQFTCSAAQPTGSPSYRFLELQPLWSPQGSNGTYTSLWFNTNWNTTFGTNTVVGIDYSPSFSNSTPSTHYAAIFRSGLVGIGTATPTGTLQVTGSGSIPTLRTVGSGTGSNYSYRAFQAGGVTEIFSLTDAGNIIQTQSAQTSTVTGYTFTGGAHTGLAASEVIDINFNLARSVVFGSSGTIATQRNVYISGTTYTSTSPTTTLTQAATLWVDAPSTGTGMASGGNLYQKRGVNAIVANNGPILVQNASFTGSGFFYQSGNSQTTIGGGPAGENIQFGASNTITASAQFNGNGGFAVSGTATLISSKYSYLSRYQLNQISGSVSPIHFAVSPTSAMSTSGTYSGSTTGFSYDDSSATTANTLGLSQFAFVATNTVVATSGTTNYTGLTVNPVLNTTSTATGTFRGINIAPTQTSIIGLTLYGITVNNGNILNGFGTGTPNVTVDIAGGLATRATSLGSIGTSQDDYAIGTGTFFRLTASTPVNITGFTGGSDGKIMIIRNVGTNTITITNEDAASTAANRITSSTGANIVLNAKGSIVLVYDATASRWLDFALR